MPYSKVIGLLLSILIATVIYLSPNILRMVNGRMIWPRLSHKILQHLLCFNRLKRFIKTHSHRQRVLSRHQELNTIELAIGWSFCDGWDGGQALINDGCYLPRCFSLAISSPNKANKPIFISKLTNEFHRRFHFD